MAIWSVLIDTLSGYSYTPLAAVEAARRALAGDRRPGFQTPAMLFGAEFAETIADTRIMALSGGRSQFRA